MVGLWNPQKYYNVIVDFVHICTPQIHNVIIEFVPAYTSHMGRCHRKSHSAYSIMFLQRFDLRSSSVMASYC